jgi:hypothetical protein
MIEKIFTIVDKNTGQELRAMFESDMLEANPMGRVESNEIAIEELRTISMENPYFDFNTRNFYDNI